jgi:hypothetical protein
MSPIETVEHLNNQAVKVLKSHKAESNQMLLVCLQAKAFSEGIENPFEWALEMVEMIDGKKVD